MKKFLKISVLLVALCLSGCKKKADEPVSKQRALTKEEAGAVADDIQAKHTAYRMSGGSSAIVLPKKALSLDTPKAADEWEYGEDYWGESGVDKADYESDWDYSRADDYDDWAYDGDEEYSSWVAERSATKSIVVPNAASLRMYEKVVMPSQGLDMLVDVNISYDIENHYARESAVVKDSDGNVDSNMEITIYYKDGALHIYENLSKYSPVVEETIPVSESTVETVFASFKETVKSMFMSYSLGSDFISSIKQYAEYGFENQFFSDDAGNLVVVMKGSVNDTIEGMTVDMSADINLAWDQYFLRSADMHINGSITGMGTMDTHVIYAYNDGCQIVLP